MADRVLNRENPEEHVRVLPSYSISIRIILHMSMTQGEMEKLKELANYRKITRKKQILKYIMKLGRVKTKYELEKIFKYSGMEKMKLNESRFSSSVRKELRSDYLKTLGK